MDLYMYYHFIHCIDETDDSVGGGYKTWFYLFWASTLTHWENKVEACLL